MNILFFLTPKSEVAYIPADESLRQACDVLRAMESMCHWNISEAEKVKLMDVKRKRNIQAVTISTDMDDLVDVITDQNFVPVIDDQEKFIGIVTRKDVIRFYHDEYRKLAKNE